MIKELIIVFLLVILHPKDFLLLGGCNEPSEIILYYEAVQYVPDTIFNQLSYDKWSVNFIDDIDSIYPHAIGYYNTKLKEVYVDDEKIKGIDCDVKSTIKLAIVHELIHAWDYEQDYPSSMIPNTNGVDCTEALAYGMTDWLFGRSVSKENEKFFHYLLNK